MGGGGVRVPQLGREQIRDVYASRLLVESHARDLLAATKSVPLDAVRANDAQNASARRAATTAAIHPVSEAGLSDAVPFEAGGEGGAQFWSFTAV